MKEIARSDCVHWGRGIHTDCQIGIKSCTATRINNQCLQFKRRERKKTIIEPEVLSGEARLRSHTSGMYFYPVLQNDQKEL
jgi:hypothetical protein